MQTVAQAPIQGKHAIVYDETYAIVKAANELWVIFEDSRMERFAIEMAPFTAVLGNVVLSETRAMWDRIAGGPAMICTSRAMGVN